MDADLMWLGAHRSDRHEVYFGDGPDELVLKSTQANNIFDPGELEPGRVYYWRIDSRTPDGVAVGKVWSFTVAPGK